MKLLYKLHLLLDAWTFLAQDGTTTVGEDAPAPPPSPTGDLMGDLWRYALIIAVVVIIALAIRYLISQQGPALKAKDLDRTQRKAIQASLKAGDLLSAGDLAMQYQAFEDAAGFFQEANVPIRAAEAYEAAGRRPEAIKQYRLAGRSDRAAQLYEKAGQIRNAAAEYAQCNQQEKAARLYLKSKDFRNAARMYVELQDWRCAGEAYERLNLSDDAAEMYERYFKEQYGLVRGNLSDIPQAREKALFVADHMIAQGRHMDAAELYEKAGYLDKAADILAKNNDIAAAAKLHVQNRDPLAAAKLYEFAGDEKQAALYRGEAALLEDDPRAAADEFARAGHFQRAAELYAQIEDNIRAAEMFEACDDLLAAAELYNLAGDITRAAEMYERSNDHVRASEIYRQLGDIDSEMRVLAQAGAWFRLGQLLFQQGRKEDALQAMQKVEAMDLHYSEACEFQGDILCEMQRFDVGYLKYRQAVINAEPNPTNLMVYYKMGRCLEEVSDYANALGIYEDIVAVDYYFKDAKARLDRIVGQMEPQQPQMHGGMRSSGNHMSGPLSRPGGMHSGGWSSATVQTSGVYSQPARYSIIDEVARGGMGVVYRAQDTVLGRIVAFKILSENLKNNATAVKYFLREAQAVAALSHPNIVTVYDAGEQGGEYYMAMEFVEGDTLKNLVARSGPFHEKLLRFILDRTCRGLAYAHERGIVHRDIKSGNIMLTRDKSLKIMDFGLAKVLDEANNQHTQAIGTPFYMSPEQILGRDLDHRSDLYSLGVTLFECATGQVPFTKGELSYHHLHTKPPNPKSINPELSDRMTKIILKLMRKEPDRRFQDANAILKAIKSK